MGDTSSRSLTDLLAHHAGAIGDRTSFRFLVFDDVPADGSRPGGAAPAYTWHELYAHALGFAHGLTDRGLAGRRVLLVYDSGLDFLVAFFGCLLAGATAVPAPPLRAPHARSLPRLAAIQQDCEAPLVVTRSRTRASLRPHLSAAPELRAVDWLTVDEMGPSEDDTGLRPAAPAATAYLQYTSGSTSRPKAVQVTQADVLANCAAMDDAWRHTDDSVMISWLPVFHDMGLVYNAMFPVFRAIPTVLMSPSAFVQRPVRWLRAHSEYHGTHSIAPNFGFDHCVRKVDPADAATLDLSCWRVAANASEPIRAATLRRFAAAFARAGLRPQALIPAYGLAEATLIVTAARAGEGARVGAFDPEAFAAGTARPVNSGHDAVSSGRPLAGFEVRIVDPDTGLPRPEGGFGEIWVAGDSVTAGYFRHPDATATSFGATLPDGTGGYLRTGDLGFVRDGELYVTGRRKDLIIVAGRNHHPQDIEATVFEAHPALRPGCAAAFAVDDGTEEHLVVVQEVVDDALPGEVAAEAVAAIRREITETHGLRADAVVLIRRATLSKTSSGKIQRSENRDRFRDGALEAVASWRGTLFGGTGEVQLTAAARADGPITATALRSWLRTRLADLTGVAAIVIDDAAPFAGYGLDSRRAAELTGDLGTLLGHPVSETLVYDHPTVERLVTALAPPPAPPSRPEPVGGPASVNRSASAARPAPLDRPVPVGGPASPSRPESERRSVPLGGPASAGRVGPEGQPVPVGGPASVGREPADRPVSRRRPDSVEERPDVAIVGIGCRVPGADSPDRLWRLLADGVDAVGEVPETRWSGPTDPALRWAGLVPDLSGFDHEFFGISRREAGVMDPQQRMLLAVGWEALEDAGIDPTALEGTDTGVFVGVWSPEFALRAGSAGFAEPYLTTGSAHSIAANRLSYALDLHGPSIAVDTACSSSLVAVHLAVRALQDGECSIALAGGSNVVLSPEVTLAFARAHLLSPTGRCRSFGADADGYVRAEGAGLVTLKRLADAIADGDDIYAVIRGSAVNHDGRTNGLTAPSASAQRSVIEAAHRRAGVRGGDIDFVEAHGSGTPVGDLIEATALGATVGADRTGPPCLIGSIKSNLGHLEAAAGVAGLIRAALALRHGTVPPSLHATDVNPRIDLPTLGLCVNSAVEPLTVAGRPALAGVSSFGFGGANAHVVLEQPARPAAEPPADAVPDRAMLLPVSARAPGALAALAARYRDLLADSGTHLAEVCHSAGRRAQHGLRAAVVGASRADLIAGLDRLSRDGDVAAARSPAGTLLFRYADEGPLVGGRLFMEERTFRVSVDECDDVLRTLAGWSLVDLLRAGPPRRWSPGLAAPARVALQIALTDLLAAWRIRPAAVTACGAGEVAAGYAAGVLDRAAAMTLAVRLGQAWSGGKVRLPSAAAGRPRVDLLSAAGGGAVDHVDAGHWERVLRREGAARPPLPGTGSVTAVDLDTGGEPDTAAAVLATLRPGADDRAALLALAGRLYEAGQPLDWARISGTTRRVRPPRYPWTTVDLGLPGTPGRPAERPAPAPVTAADPDVREMARGALADRPGEGSVSPPVTTGDPDVREMARGARADRPGEGWVSPPVRAGDPEVGGVGRGALADRPGEGWVSPPVTAADPDIRGIVRGALAELLGMPPERIDDHSTFDRLGLDSLSGVDLHERLQRDLHTALPPTVVLNYPTVALLAGFLTDHIAATPAEPGGGTTSADEQIVDELIEDLGGLLAELFEQPPSGED